MSEFKNHIVDTFGFTEKEFETISDFFYSKELKKGEYFQRSRHVVRELGFVEKGILREFLYADGRDITKWFSTPGGFAVDLSGFLNATLAKVNYQAQTDTKLLVISKKDYDKIGEKIPQWDTLEKLFLIKCFSVLENRVISHLTMNAEERYKHLFDFQPMLFNEVPLNQIASMLGMSPETLSRIRKRQTK